MNVQTGSRFAVPFILEALIHGMDEGPREQSLICREILEQSSMKTVLASMPVQVRKLREVLKPLREKLWHKEMTHVGWTDELRARMAIDKLIERCTSTLADQGMQ